MKRQKKSTTSSIKTDFEPYFKVIAADLSLKRPGFCIVNLAKYDDGYRVEYFATFSVDNKTKTKPHGEILNEIYTFLEYLGRDVKVPTYFVREKAINSRGAMSEIGIFKVVGVTDLWLQKWGIFSKEWEEIYPITVKKLVTGSGKSDKNAVASALEKYFGQREYPNDDESDSAAVAAAFLIQHGIFKGCEIDVEEKSDGVSDNS